MKSTFERAEHAAKQAVAKLLISPRMGRILGRVFRDRIPACGLLVDTSSPLIQPEIKALLAFRMYESAERRLVTRYLRLDLPVVELGASIGYITAHISRRRPSRQIAVEANSYLLPLIENLLRLNNLDTVQLVYGAIDYSGNDIVHFCLNSANTGSAVAGSAAISQEATDVEVPAFTLRDVVDREHFERFVLVCDIEGAERGMIMEESVGVAQRCQQMIIELHAGDFKRQRISSESLAQAVQERWGMAAVRRDGNNWLFQRQD